MKGAIFDLDGTILDSLWIWEEIDRRFLAKRGIAMPEDYVDAVNRMEFSQAAEYTIARFGLPDALESLMSEWTAMTRDAYAHEIALKPGVKAYLESLSSRGVRLGIATSSTPELFAPALENNGILRLFSAIATTSEVPHGKDRPDVYLLAAERLGMVPSECIVFEDTLPGIRSASSAGFITAGVRDRFSENDAQAIKALSDFWIDTFESALWHMASCFISPVLLSPF